MHFLRLSFLLATVLAASGVSAQEAPAPVKEAPAADSKPAVEQGGVKDSAPSHPVRKGPSEEQVKIFKALSETSKDKLRDVLRNKREQFQTMTEDQRRAFFEAALKKAAAEDTPGQSGSPGAPLSAKKAADPTKAREREAHRQAYEALSDEAKGKLREMFRDNRKKLAAMSEEERRAFIDSYFKKTAEADAASRNGK